MALPEIQLSFQHLITLSQLYCFCTRQQQQQVLEDNYQDACKPSLKLKNHHHQELKKLFSNNHFVCISSTLILKIFFLFYQNALINLLYRILHRLRLWQIESNAFSKLPLIYSLDKGHHIPLMNISYFLLRTSSLLHSTSEFYFLFSSLYFLVLIFYILQYTTCVLLTTL